MPASFAPSLPLRALTLVAALAGVAASPSPLVVANATAANATVVYTAAQVGDYQVCGPRRLLQRLHPRQHLLLRLRLHLHQR